MVVTTKLTLTDELPLTCTRSGTCCHGKTVRLNPWELAHLAEAKGLSRGRSATDTAILAASSFASTVHWAGNSSRRATSMCPILDAAYMPDAPWSVGYIRLAAESRARSSPICTRGAIFPAWKGVRKFSICPI